jgi:hypothetical protein
MLSSHLQLRLTLAVAGSREYLARSFRRPSLKFPTQGHCGHLNIVTSLDQSLQPQPLQAHHSCLCVRRHLLSALIHVPVALIVVGFSHPPRLRIGLSMIGVWRPTTTGHVSFHLGAPIDGCQLGVVQAVPEQLCPIPTAVQALSTVNGIPTLVPKVAVAASIVLAL